MAEERNTGLARAPEPDIDTDATKEELQRRMEEARESITQTVAEIKETVTNQYQQVRESISDSLDWREQFRRRPLAFSAGALGAGLLLGYSVGGVFGGASDDDDDYEGDTEDEDVQASIRASNRSYAAQPVTGYVSSPSTYGGASPSMHDSSTQYASAPPSQSAYSPAAASPASDVGPDSRPSYSSGYAGAGASASGEVEEPSKPGLYTRVKESGIIDKFKETKAYDRLQDELSSLGDRFVEELSSTARNVVVPALLGKLKDLVGIDLSTQREVAQRSKLEHQAASAQAAADSASGEPPPQGTAAGR